GETPLPLTQTKSELPVRGNSSLRIKLFRPARPPGACPARCRGQLPLPESAAGPRLSPKPTQHGWSESRSEESAADCREPAVPFRIRQARLRRSFRLSAPPPDPLHSPADRARC